uniref:Charged multivesicular body protein 2a (inferred by orthology to a human protein) n=1 Tax=Strongyloides venezuelensis TaxID=75913 RepID=A0A0K0F2F6_STRVS
MMEAIFGTRKTPAEILRANQRALNKAIRELDREKARLEAEEKKVVNEIKRMAKLNQMDTVRILAKQIVRTRNYCKKFTMMKATIQTVSLKIATLKSQDSMATAMKGVTLAMKKMNNRMNLPQIENIMREFEKQSAIMDMKEEMLDDTVDDSMGEVGDEEETDGIVNQILDELGIQMGNELNGLPEGTQGIAASAQTNKPVPEGVMSDADADLAARLENLRRG